jgi:hypothetical protein
MTLSDHSNSITLGTSINIVSVTKRGASKSSILKQVEKVSNQQHLTVQFHESFNFKASLFYDSSNKCHPKIFRLNINRVTRSEQNNYEFITTCIGYVIVELHHHANTGTTSYQLPIRVESGGGEAAAGGGKSSPYGELEINLQMLSNLDDVVDDTSSIGSDLSFIHKEQTISPQHSRKSSQGTPASPSHPHRLVGGTIPEAGKSNWSFNSTTILQQETEVKLTEISIVKMHLDRMTVEKENLESIQKMHLQEIIKLQNEIKEMKLERTKPSRSLGDQDGNSSLLSTSEISLGTLESETTNGSSSMTPKTSFSSAPSENVILSIDRMVELENENKSLKMELESWKERYEQLLLVTLPVEEKALNAESS